MLCGLEKGGARMSALKEIFSEPFYADSVCGDMIAIHTIAKFNEHHDERGRFESGDSSSGIVAYHGTPHIVPEFSTKFIGSGEGAASYGVGLYFAESPAVAENYKNALSETDVVFPDGRRLNELQLSEGSLEAFRVAVDNGHSLVRAKEILSAIKSPSVRIQDALETLSSWERQGVKLQTGGNTYQVKIDVKPEELLDWNKPLKDQSEQVQRAARSLWSFSPDITGEGIYQIAIQLRYLRNPKWNTPEKVGATFGSASVEQKNGSAELLKVGIPGLRYLDQGSRSVEVAGPSDDGKWLVYGQASGRKIHKEFSDKETADAFADSHQTHNLVIFDDSRVHITHVNGKELTKDEALAKTKEWQEELHPRGEGGRFATTDAVFEGDDRPPQQVASLTKSDFAKGFSVPHRDYVRIDITNLNPLSIEGRPRLKVEGNLINAKTGAKIGFFEHLYGIDKREQFYADNVRLEILPGYQQSGIGMDFINQSEKFDKELGVKYVTLVASMTAGGLAWALNGYDFLDENETEDARDFFGSQLSNEHEAGRLTEGQFSESAERLSGLTHSWQFAIYETPTQREFGRETMLALGKSSGWIGAKELDGNGLGYKIGRAYQRLKVKRPKEKEHEY
jgi:GNAT superfamily N-acetyltransferase